MSAEASKLLSVIVPVFNMAGDDRLKWCMDSLTSQTLEEKRPGSMEIIAVDDCSTDSSLDILRGYGERFPGLVRVIASPENRHQGGAKNLGLAEAAGEWIGFIDADDWVTADYYERLICEAERTGADMAGCDYCLVDSHTMTATERIPANKPEQTGELDDNKYRLLLLDSGSLVVKIYRRHIIFGDEGSAKEAQPGRHGSGTFPEGIFYEDNAVANTWMLRAGHFAYIPEPLYFYYQHEGSTVHTLKKRNMMDRREAGLFMLEAARTGGYLERFRPEIEFLFTELFYRNTLFSVMAVFRDRSIAADFDRKWIYDFTRELADTMRATFPDFQQNPYYLQRIDAEERGFMALHIKSQLLFYYKYRALWFLRNLRSGR